MLNAQLTTGVTSGRHCRMKAYVSVFPFPQLTEDCTINMFPMTGYYILNIEKIIKKNIYINMINLHTINEINLAAQ